MRTSTCRLRVPDPPVLLTEGVLLSAAGVRGEAWMKLTLPLCPGLVAISAVAIGAPIAIGLS